MFEESIFSIMLWKNCLISKVVIGKLTMLVLVLQQQIPTSFPLECPFMHEGEAIERFSSVLQARGWISNTCQCDGLDGEHRLSVRVLVECKRFCW